MNEYIEKRVAELTAEKEETLNEFAQGEHQDVLAERNIRISMELKFLDKLSKADIMISLPSDEQIIQKRKEILNDGKSRTEDEFAIELIRWAEGKRLGNC